MNDHKIINTHFLIRRHSMLCFLFCLGYHSSFRIPLSFYSTMNQLSIHNRSYRDFQKKFDFIKTRGFKSNHSSVYCEALECGPTLLYICYSERPSVQIAPNVMFEHAWRELSEITVNHDRIVCLRTDSELLFNLW